MSRSSLKFLLWLLTLTPINVLALSDDDVSWPREIIVDEGTVIIYQPQPEKRQEDRIFARAAIALELHARTEPVFGAIWFNAQVLIDRDERTATFLDVNITRVRFPNEDESKALKLY